VAGIGRDGMRGMRHLARDATVAGPFRPRLR
jgi:hypothetical protein